MEMQEIDVLIVGGGPTGVTLALELAVHKIPFRVVDKEIQRSDKSRALGIQPRTLELLNRHGDVRKLVSKGNLSSGTTFYLNGKKAADIDLTGLVEDSVFPLILIISQCETEAYLDECLAKHGFAVEKGLEATSIVQDPDGVTVKLSNSSGVEETVRAKYVVGADGAHSSVRRAATGLTFQGAAYPQDFILCDAHVRNSKLAWNRFSLCMGRGSLAVFPLKDGTCRVVASRMNPNPDVEPKLEDFQEMLNQLHPEAGELYDPTWITKFHLHHRGVNSYRDGRLFVAGDAAHIHSPAGAQGMNTGIQDSINLGWKLAKVIRGKKPDSFLDSYDRERRPVGQHLLETSDKMFTWGCSSNPFFISFRNIIFTWGLPWFVSSRDRRANIFKFISEFSINYRDSSVVGTVPGYSGPVMGGDRVPDRIIKSMGQERQFLELITPDTHHLVLFSGVGSDAVTEESMREALANFESKNADEAKIHMIFDEAVDGSDGAGRPRHVDVGNHLHKEFGCSKPAYVYIRPDSYVEHIGLLSEFKALLEWLG
ncbi:FAD binding domain-containing protein [Daldinia caldariorum]|uniref:FAD binding domain-containing protein n=1 Tax=Daldinia caldariorum TaxID=326644 RepID=UPI0020074570|nr:FAD binding domain-containing protein [Daldinia caldariorum]KAI1470048.1 FAD binding domain-containing protein [Daldinia caldariorum]